MLIRLCQACAANRLTAAGPACIIYEYQAAPTMYNVLTAPVESTKYNGWSNFKTWNVSLWISNSERLYQLSLTCNSYEEFKCKLGVPDINTFETPDGVDFDDPSLNIAELDELFQVED